MGSLVVRLGFIVLSKRMMKASSFLATGNNDGDGDDDDDDDDDDDVAITNDDEDLP